MKSTRDLRFQGLRVSIKKTQSLLNLMTLIIFHHTLAPIAVYMKPSVLLNVELKIVINGFAMEKG